MIFGILLTGSSAGGHAFLHALGTRDGGPEDRRLNPPATREATLLKQAHRESNGFASPIHGGSFPCRRGVQPAVRSDLAREHRSSGSPSAAGPRGVQQLADAVLVGGAPAQQLEETPQVAFDAE